MASTNKTANLSLNQWTLDDPFLMEDFNADNRKLDAAIGGISAFTLLHEVITSAQAAEIYILLPAIDWALYRYVFMDVDLRVGGNSDTIMIRKNDSFSDTLNVIDTSGGVGGHIGKMIGATYSNRTEVDINGGILFMPKKDADNKVKTLFKDYRQLGMSYSDTQYRNLTQIDIRSGHTGGFLMPGAVIRFWGVK